MQQRMLRRLRDPGEPDPGRSQARKAALDNSRWPLGAEQLVTACPLCKYNLTRNAHGLPIVYFTQLLAQALGLTEEG